MRKHYRIYLLYWLITCCFTVNAQTILKYNVNASNGWIPYFISNSPDNPGIIGELVPLILSQANISIENHNFPPKEPTMLLKMAYSTLILSVLAGLKIKIWVMILRNRYQY